jgi:hypothetical protein
MKLMSSQKVMFEEFPSQVVEGLTLQMLIDAAHDIGRVSDSAALLLLLHSLTPLSVMLHSRWAPLALKPSDSDFGHWKLGASRFPYSFRKIQRFFLGGWIIGKPHTAEPLINRWWTCGDKVIGTTGTTGTRTWDPLTVGQTPYHSTMDLHDWWNWLLIK